MNRRHQSNWLNLIVWGLDPLESLTPLDGLIACASKLTERNIRLIGMADAVRQSGVTYADAFHRLIRLDMEARDWTSSFIRAARNLEGEKILIPACPRTFRLACQKAGLLKGAGIRFAGPTLRLLEFPIRMETLLGAHCPDTIGNLEWIAGKTVKTLEDHAKTLGFPVMLSSRDRQFCWIVKNPEMLTASSRRYFKKHTTSLMVRHYEGNEEAYQVSAVLDGSDETGTMAMVKEINNDPESESWMFLAINDHRLFEISRDIFQKLHRLSGPVNLRFIKYGNSGWLADRLSFGFPAWMELPASDGVNLLEQYIRIVLREPSIPSHKISIAPPGRLIVFNSIDVPLPAAEWLKLVGSGGSEL